MRKCSFLEWRRREGVEGLQFVDTSCELLAITRYQPGSSVVSSKKKYKYKFKFKLCYLCTILLTTYYICYNSKTSPSSKGCTLVPPPPHFFEKRSKLSFITWMKNQISTKNFKCAWAFDVTYIGNCDRKIITAVLNF